MDEMLVQLWSVEATRTTHLCRKMLTEDEDSRWSEDARGWTDLRPGLESCRRCGTEHTLHREQ